MEGYVYIKERQIRERVKRGEYLTEIGNKLLQLISPQSKAKYTSSMHHSTNEIKVEPQVQAPLFYEEGDIVIGKCRNQPLWPAVVKAFRGYDEDEVQVFTVDFFQGGSYANLETYLLTPLTPRILAKMRNLYSSNKKILSALSLAQANLKRLEQSVRCSSARLERFQALYHPERDQDRFFEDVDRLPSETFRANRQALRGNKELLPKIDQFYYDRKGKKVKSKEFLKRRLVLSSGILSIKVEIFEQPHNLKPNQITTRIAEEGMMNIAISKRAFRKGQRQEKQMESQEIQLSDVTYSYPNPFSPLESSNKLEPNMRIARTTNLML